MLGLHKSIDNKAVTMNIQQAYNILGISFNSIATRNEIEGAYRDAIYPYHPDRNLGASDEILEQNNLKLKQFEQAKERLLKLDNVSLDNILGTLEKNYDQSLEQLQQQIDSMQEVLDINPEFAGLDFNQLINDKKDEYKRIVRDKAEACEKIEQWVNLFERAYLNYLEAPLQTPKALQEILKYNQKTGAWQFTRSTIDLTNIDNDDERLNTLTWVYIMLDSGRLNSRCPIVFKTGELPGSQLQALLVNLIEIEYYLNYARNSLVSDVVKFLIEKASLIALSFIAWGIAVKTGSFRLYAVNYSIISLAIALSLAVLDLIVKNRLSENHYHQIKPIITFINNIASILAISVFSCVYGPQLWMIALVPDMIITAIRAINKLYHFRDNHFNYGKFTELLFNGNVVNESIVKSEVKDEFQNVLERIKSSGVLDAEQLRQVVAKVGSGTLGTSSSLLTPLRNARIRQMTPDQEALQHFGVGKTMPKLIKWH